MNVSVTGRVSIISAAPEECVISSPCERLAPLHPHARNKVIAKYNTLFIMILEF
jgi:hypothetical protein